MLSANDIGAVVIGRNEGERLRLCLESLSHLKLIVYVDSGSTDGSVELATKMGVILVKLDLTQPFTAARARNAGFNALLSNSPTLKYVQFVDGDCQLISGWLKTASEFLEQHPKHAVVCGRRKERFPNASIYNRLCDMEWNTPVGEATACGGDALIRVAALKEIQGYRNDLIAGEEPEMCFRLRQKGWKIYRLEADMTWHDAGLTQFKQWWQRTKRGGFAFAAGSDLHGKSEEKYWVKETRSILFWGGIIPASLLVLGLIASPLFLLGLFIYLIQILKIAFLHPVDKNSRKNSFFYGFFVVLGKFPQMIGLLNFASLKLLSKKPTLIEYK